jgi:heavy metal sensor kinase
MRLSIRWRLALWNTAALAVVLTAFAAMIYYALAREHLERIDRGLRKEFQELADDPKRVRDPAALAEWIADLREDDNISCVVYGPDGKIIGKTKELSEEDVPPAPAAGEGSRLYDAAAPGGRRRTLEGRVRVDDRDYAVVLMVPLKEVDEEMGHFLTAILVVVPFALLAALACGYFLARRALAPMEQLRRRTEEITAARLDRRLPVANPHDELGRLAGTINAMIARLERSFAEIRRFTADASHELRTPLTAIRLEAEVALTKPLGPEERDQLLGNILEECERLGRLTDQLLALAREDVGAAALPREPLDLAGLVRGVVETMRPLAEARGLKLHAAADGPLPVRGDEGRLRQVFYNLLDNAVKYTPEGGEVAVALGRRAGSAVAAVRDTGIGIAAEHLPHLFERFYRVDPSRGRGQGGAGLGLSIAQSVVAAHDGKIEVASEPGRGTTVTVTLHLAQEEKA